MYTRKDNSVIILNKLFYHCAFKITCFGYSHASNNLLYMFPLNETVSSLHLLIDRKYIHV